MAQRGSARVGQASNTDVDVYRLLVGGGADSARIARDAAGRGLSVLWFEQDDPTTHTSSVDAKPIHAGLRHLDHGDVRLICGSRVECGRPGGMLPHIIQPLRFTVPPMNSPRPKSFVRSTFACNACARAPLPGGGAMLPDAYPAPAAAMAV